MLMCMRFAVSLRRSHEFSKHINFNIHSSEAYRSNFLELVDRTNAGLGIVDLGGCYSVTVVLLAVKKGEEGMRQNDSCMNCWHFKYIKECKEIGEHIGECRRYPPKIVYTGEDPGREVFTYGFFPEVYASAFCGEHKDIEP